MAINIDMREAIEEGAQKVIDLLIDKYDQLGMRASGEWADSLEYDISDRAVIIRGLDYTEYLSRGREPGGDPPVRAIYNWMMRKPGFSGEKTLGRAIAISKTIGAQGTRYWQQGGTDLVDFLADPEVIRTFFGHISDIVSVQISEQLLRDFEDLDTN